MKKALLLILLALYGCSVRDNQEYCPRQLLTVVFTPGEETKAPSEASESAVSHLSILLFRDGSSTPYAFGSASGGSLTLSVASGTYTVYAIANFPSFTPSPSTNPSSIASMRSQLRDNSRSALVMSGATRKSITSSGTVAVPVLRHTSKVTLKCVSVDFGGTFLEGETVHLKKCYLDNVWSSCSFGASSDGTSPEVTDPSGSGTWYNLHGHIPSEADELLFADFVKDIPDGSSCADREYFYCTPNPSAETGENAVPCCTRLVLEASVGEGSGDTCYYHVDLPGMAPNSAYSVSVTIGYSGGDGPESNLGRLNVSAEIDVEDYSVSDMRVTL